MDFTGSVPFAQLLGTLQDCCQRAALRLAAERVEGTTREVELLRADLAATKQNLDKAEGDKTRVCTPCHRMMSA